MVLRIRTFEMDRDYGQVMELWRQAGPGIQLSASDKPEEIRKKLQRDPDLFLVAECDGEILGAVLGGFDGRRGLVHHLAVHVGARCLGVGRELMNELEARLRRKGCLKYYLLVTEENEGARRFYDSIGVEEMEVRVMGKAIL